MGVVGSNSYTIVHPNTAQIVADSCIAEAGTDTAAFVVETFVDTADTAEGL